MSSGKGKLYLITEKHSKLYCFIHTIFVYRKTETVTAEE